MEFIQKKYSIYLPIGTVAEFTVHADIDTCGGQLVGNKSIASVIHVQGEGCSFRIGIRSEDVRICMEMEG